MSKIGSNVGDLVGNTPIVLLNKVTDGCVAKVAVKLEGFEPCSSVKDRIGLNMIEAAEKSGELKPGYTIVEPTSGNTGIGLAMVAASKGYKVILTMPDTMSLERRVLLKALGATVVLTPAAKGIRGCLAKAEEILKSLGGSGFMPQQFENPANPEIHFQTTGPELWRDTNGKIDCLVSGVGTGGTITGCARYFKTCNKKVDIVAVEPVESPVISGGQPGPHKIQGIGAGFVPKNLDTQLLNRVELVSSDEAMEMARRLAKEEGLFVGISSGAAAVAAIRLAKEEKYRDKLIVFISASCGDRYLSTLLFANESKEAREQVAEDVNVPPPAAGATPYRPPAHLQLQPLPVVSAPPAGSTTAATTSTTNTSTTTTTVVKRSKDQSPDFISAIIKPISIIGLMFFVWRFLKRARA